MAPGIKTLQYKVFRAESVAQKFVHLDFPKLGSKKTLFSLRKGSWPLSWGEEKGLEHLRKGSWQGWQSDEQLRKGSWQGWQSDEQLRKALGIKTL